MKLVNIIEVKPNPRNPRIIKDNKFKKLVKSIQEFPDMLNKRPLIVFTDVDGKYVVLGGNMRLRAIQELNYTEVPIIIADDWTEEQKAEFLIKDNVGFGEWDWDQLANEWDAEKLDDWGLDVIKHDWEDLDYIDQEIAAPNPVGNNTIQIILAEVFQDQKDEIFEHVKSFIQENYSGCEVK